MAVVEVALGRLSSTVASKWQALVGNVGARVLQFLVKVLAALATALERLELENPLMSISPPVGGIASPFKGYQSSD